MSEHGSTTYIHLLHGHAIEQVPEQLVGVHLVPLVPVFALSVEGLHERLCADCALLAGPQLYEGVCEGGGAGGGHGGERVSVSLCASRGSPGIILPGICSQRQALWEWILGEELQGWARLHCGRVWRWCLSCSCIRTRICIGRRCRRLHRLYGSRVLCQGIPQRPRRGQALEDGAEIA